MINECGHPLCKNCVDNLFARNSGNCHICNRMLKKNGYREQVFDDPFIDKETNIRKKLRKIYNLKADDFPSLREFHDYQEKFETIVYNLVFETNVPETNAEIQEFEEKNKERIDKNKRRLDEDQKWIEDNLRDERAMKTRLTEVVQQESKEKENNSAIADTKAIMNELRESNVAAEVILDRERKKQIEKDLEEKEEQEKKKRRNKEILQDRKRCADNMSFNAAMRIAGRPYNHKSLDLQLNGPPMPTQSQIETMGYLNHMRPASLGRIAGGYTASIGCVRALFESRIDLLSF